ncbi:hypothetical protein ACFHYQ_03855 [Sphaerimonospora cavernae]|uniref:Uncharacterized protein n=1 Tax=Sphaerimonospora cavernae TaxID=1740611 RepID=A0ABV6U2P3_9ACTN
MQFIHVHLNIPFELTVPPDLPAVVYAQATEEQRIEHASLAYDQLGMAVLGVFLMARTLAEAEAVAVAAIHQAIAALPQFDGVVVQEATGFRNSICGYLPDLRKVFTPHACVTVCLNS